MEMARIPPLMLRCKSEIPRIPTDRIRSPETGGFIFIDETGNSLILEQFMPLTGGTRFVSHDFTK